MPKASVSTIGARKQRPKMVSDSGAEYEVAAVTPGQAELWLAKNTDNRRIRPATVARYARDMETGSFIENGAAVCFAKDGALLDGQHRLEAVVQSGATVPMLVVRNLERRAQHTIDDGAKRTLGDRFTFNGHQNAHTAAAVTRRILMWQAGYKHNSGQYQPSTAEALELVSTDPTVGIAIEAAVKLRTGRLLPPTIIGLTWWLFSNLSEDQCAVFWDGLHSGAGLTEADPIHIVRNQIIRRNAEPGRIPESVYLAWVIKAWNFWRADRELSPSYKFRLRPDEKFPEPK
jgi:hypothetical protein